MALEIPGCCDTQYELIRKILLSLDSLANDGGPPSGAAGGTLGGTYPNPTIATGGSGNFTPGSVIFVGATGGLAEDNPDFIYDSTNNALTVDGVRLFSNPANSVFLGQVAGNFTMTGDFNTGLGFHALQSLTTGNSNVAIGYNSLDSATTSTNNVAVGYNTLSTVGAAGGGHVAVGYNALAANTTGDNNVAVGNQALQANTTAFNNIAIGLLAMSANLTGSNNVTVGRNALGAQTSGGSNVALGYFALSAITGANNNTAVGFESQRNATGGSDNTSVGYRSLLSRSTGFNNSGFGREALRNLTTGINNTATGLQSTQALNTGNANTASGVGSLNSTTTGSNNVAVGYQTGYTLVPANANITGSSNTWVGYQAGPGSATQLDNSAAFGNQALVSASNCIVLGGTGANAVFVGIGTTIPTSVFHVLGAIATAISTKTVDYPAVATDSVLLVDATAAPVTITLPTPVGIPGRVYTVKKIDATANAVTIATAAGTIDGAATKATVTQYESFSFVSDNANWFII